MGKIFSVAWLLLFVVVGCGGGGARPLQSTPEPETPLKIDEISPPPGRMSVPAGQRDWIPMTITSGNGDALVQAIRDRSTLGLILPNVWRGGEMEDRIFQMIKLAAPDTEVVARGSAALGGLLGGRKGILEATPWGSDEHGAPILVPKEHPLYRQWLSGNSPANGAEALLVVRPLRVDDSGRQLLRETKQGGCEGILRELREAVADAEGFFAPYEQEASRALHQSFKQHLAVALPFWMDELVAQQSTAAAGSPGAQCIEGYLKWLDQYRSCIQAPCKGAPSLSATGGGTVGMTLEKDITLDACPTNGMRDYPAVLAELASRSVLEVMPHLDNGWVAELIRYDGLTRLTAEIEAGCAPRHRRIDMEALEEAREGVSRYLTRLEGGAFQGMWEEASGQSRFAGVGPVKVLARVRVIADDPAVEVLDLAKDMRRMERCPQVKERPIQVILVDRKSAEVVFMGIFYEEGLLCHGLPPG